ncbi:dynamin family protein [Longimicrobium sp.]|uniref:dynamin family protein n=1 Tax=Longimicrobium sp. TaxID=2029185 RepID=UPI003B3B5A96
MFDTRLRERAEEVFRRGQERTAGRPALEPLHHALGDALDRLGQPMRVAVVGKIKAGKSTFINALLGEPLVATGAEELTYNVNRLRYGEQQSLMVHFKDGRPPQPHALEELEALTRRREEHRDFLSSIRHVEVFYPNDFLRAFDLVDTPGLKSFFEQDAQNTLDFLGLSAEDVQLATEQEASGADAVLYLFQGGMSQSDLETVVDFQGPALGQVTPINAIGVLTMADTYWSHNAPAEEGGDPMAAGGRVARRYAEEPRSRGVFYGIYPVAGKLALGAQTLTPHAFAMLQRLAEVSERRLASLLGSPDRFCGREYEDVPLPAEARQELWDQLDPFGCWRACALIRDGAVSSLNELRTALLTESGVPAVHQLVLSHFGNRSLIIKLNSAVQRVASVCHVEKQRPLGSERRIVEEVAADVERLARQEHEFLEQEVLRGHYQGRLELEEEEVQQLLQVTGEQGRSLQARLGLLPGDPVYLDEMLFLARERLRRWQALANDFLAGRETVRAAEVVARSYERVLHALLQVRQQLGL